jgi:glycosyltransferase involved in cell wall biosynthesis
LEENILPLHRFCFVESAPVERVDGKYVTYTWAKQLIQDTIQWFPQSTVVCPSARHGAAKEKDSAANDPATQEVAGPPMPRRNARRYLAHLPLLWRANGAANETDFSAIDSTGLEVVCLPMPRGRAGRYLEHLPLLWRAIGSSDLVCVDMPTETGFLAALLCKLRSKPLVTQIIGDWEAAIKCGKPPGISTWVTAKFAKLMSVATVRCSQLVFAQGETLATQFRDVNPRAVAASMVHSTLTDNVFCQRDLTEFHSPVRILSVMALLPLKRPGAVLEAIQGLHSRGYSVEWWCVGDGPERTNLEKTVQQQGLSGTVRFLGYKSLGPSLLALYREADIFVHSSMTEGVPHCLLEAMANSLPIVTTSAGGIPGIVKDGSDAIVVAPGNARELGDGILRLLNDPPLAKRMGESAYRRAKCFHSAFLAEQRRKLIEKTFGAIAA